MVELTKKVLLQQLPGRKKNIWRKPKWAKKSFQCSQLYLCIDFSSIRSLSNIHM